MASLPLDIVALVRPSLDPAPIRALEATAASRVAGLSEMALGRFVRQSASEGGDPMLAEQALQAAFALKQASQAEATAILSHPAYCHWMKGAYRLAQSDVATRGRWISRIADFLWPLAVNDNQADMQWHTMLDDRGGLRCVTGRRYFEFGRYRAGQPVTVRADRGTRYMVIALADGMAVHVPFEDLVDGAAGQGVSIEEHGYEIFHLPMIAEDRIEFGHRDPSLRVHFTGTHQRKTGVDFFATSSEILDEAPDAARFDAIIADLGRLWPEAHLELPYITRALVPLRSNGDKRLGFTVSSRQGAIFLDDIDDRRLLHNIVHETAHVKLRHIQLVDMMLEDWEDESSLFAVPWREDKRPLPGIFEGLFVFAHVLELEKRIVARDYAEDDGTAGRLARDLAAAMAILRDHGKLTAGGRAFLEAMGRWIG